MSVQEPEAGFGLIIFDCDGVLVDSEPVISAAHVAVLGECGYRTTGQELLDRFTGVPEPEVLATLERESGLRFPASYHARVSAQIDRAFDAALEAMPGMRELLIRLRTRRCVASSGPPERVRRSLERTGLLEFFDPNIFTASMVARGKPAPDLFLHAAGSLRTDPGRCLVVEDSPAGVRAGVAAGMAVIGFCGGSHCRTGHAAALLEHGAGAVVATAGELGEALAASCGVSA